MGPNDFGCYYQVYKDREATRRVLTQFRKHHPNNPIYMVSDGGLDFSDIAKEFNCKYTHSWLNIGYWSHTKPEVIDYRATNGEHGHCYGWNAEEAMVYLDRFAKACLNTNKDFIMLLADDVIVNRPISINDDFDITYGGFNPFDFKELGKKINLPDYYREDTYPTGWGMCCGNFVKISNFLVAYLKHRNELYFNYDKIYHGGLEGIGFMDTIMTALLWLDCCGNRKLKEITNPLYSEHDSGATIFHDRSKRNSTKV